MQDRIDGVPAKQDECPATEQHSDEQMAQPQTDTRFDDGDWHRRATCLTRLAEAGARFTDSTTVYADICDAIEEMIPRAQAYLHLLTATGDSMVRYASRDAAASEIPSEWGTRLPMGIGRISQIFDRREPIIMDYAHPHVKDRVPTFAMKYGYLCAISIPVVSGDEVYGILSLSFKRVVEWMSDDLEYLEDVGCVIGTAVNRLRTTRNFSELALLEERQRLSAEIHDNVSHYLGSLSLCAASAMESYREGNDASVRRGLAKIESICGDTMRVFRDEMLSLRAPLERTDEWSSQVARILENFQKEWDIRTTLELNVKNEPLTMNLQSSLQLTRILNECLSNVLRHAKATHVIVTLYEDGRVMNMSVEDNGHGFDTRNVAPERLGLKIMQERATATGGELIIRSSPHGTIVSVEVPRIGKLD